MNPGAGDPDPPLLSYTIGRLDRAVRARLRQLLTPFELSVPELATLSVLRRRPGLSNAQLARRALILPQSMIQVLAGLEDRGLVARSPDPAHARVLRARLTPAGRELLVGAESAAQAFDAELIAAAGGADEAARIAAVLRRWSALAGERAS